MANPVISGLKRAPKWAWYVVAGIGLGGAAIQLYRARDERTAALNETVDGSAAGESGGYVGLNPSPQPGIVVPPVIIPQQSSDPLAGILPLQDLYLSSVGSLIEGFKDVSQGWKDVYTPLIDQNSDLIGIIGGQLQAPLSPMEIVAIANAGQPPQRYEPPPVVATPPPAQLPAPSPPPPAPAPAQPSVSYENRTRDNGKSGAARRAWCNRVKIHRYPDGRAVVVSEDKIHDGAC